MRQFSGFATPEETNRRYHYLLEQGQTGLSVAFDLPTLMGYDADHPHRRSAKWASAASSISSLEDMEILFRGIPLGEVTVSMTINSPGRGPVGHVPGGGREAGRGLVAALGHPAERHPEGIHRAEGIHLSAAAFHAAGDRHHRIRRAPHAASSIRFRSAAITFARPDRRRCRNWRSPCATASSTWSGRSSAAWPIDEFAPRLSFFFNAHNDFFEEIAKYRAARKIWAETMRDRYGAQRRAQPETALPRADRRLFAHLAAAVQQRGAHRRCRRWPRCSAARSRCTPIRSTKPTRCRASTP